MIKFLSNLSDLTSPQNWFPQARKIRRKVYYHLGPTNSGKTHSALKSLSEAKTGIYCAPLRLLAWEIQEKLVQKNVQCNLITGQEQILVDNPTHLSCTVEKCPVDSNIHYECAVIDEIQMIDDDHRGSAWTAAFLGLCSDEIHLCGDERALKLIHNLCIMTGDTLIKKSYSRLSDLTVEENIIHSVSQLKQGDCIIAFSKMQLFKLKDLINQKSKNYNSPEKNRFNRCAVIFGNLPPETKKKQAQLFNEGKEKGISFLLATDAVSYK
jgi:ATP-dependent RNA helicase SUPV3L1/SUV3